MLCLLAVTDEDSNTLEDEDESGMKHCTYWGKVFESRTEVQKAPDDIQWEIDKREFDEMMATKQESGPGPDRIRYNFYRHAGGWLGFQFLFA